MNNSAFYYFIIVGALSYFCGAIPWAFIIGKINGIDIRQHGSGNVGATNVMRTLGKKWGVLCFILDFLKGFIPVLFARILSSNLSANAFEHLPIIAGAATVIGHIFPVFLGFKGGKGVATSAGVLFALSPLCLLASALVWVVFFYSFRYVSVASIVSAIALPIIAIIFNRFGIERNPQPILALFLALAILSLIRHRENIRRLIEGTENKFEKKKNVQPEKQNS